MMAPQALRLSEILSRLDREGLLISSPADDPLVKGIRDDSRRVCAGDLFCAWSGTAADSHGFLPVAEGAGAVAALVERRVEDCGVPQVVVRDGRRAAAVAAGAFYGDPDVSLKLIGVTGTNGKTTTVWLLRHLLSGRYRAATLGTLGAILPDGQPLAGSESLTTPGPVDLAATLRLLVDRGVEAIAMEVSSHALEQGRVHALRYDAAVFTNLSRDHLDYHGTLESYLAAKLKLADLLGPEGVAIVNAEDPAWSALDRRSPRTLRFALSDGGDVRAADLVLTSSGARFRLIGPGGQAMVELPLLGSFNVQNALGAAAAALALGLPVDEVAARLGTTPQVPGRLEVVSLVPCPVLRDYAHTPDALERVLAALKPLVPGRLIVVFGAGGDRDRGKRPLMGGVAERWADVAIVTSDNPRTEDPEAIIDEIVKGMSRRDHHRVVNRREAIARALELAGKGDLVVLAGKGHETYQILGTEKVPFDEREIVRDLLDGKVPEVSA